MWCIKVDWEHPAPAVNTLIDSPLHLVAPIRKSKCRGTAGINFLNNYLRISFFFCTFVANNK